MLFREKLVELRTAAGLTQAAMATSSGVPLSTVKKYEQGDTAARLNFSFIVALAKALGVDCGAFAECSDVAGQVEPPVAEVKAVEVKAAAKGKRKKS